MFVSPLKEWLAHGNRFGTSIPSTPGTKPCTSRHVPERGDEEVARSHVEREEPSVHRQRFSRGGGVVWTAGCAVLGRDGEEAPKEKSGKKPPDSVRAWQSGLAPPGREMLLSGTGKTVALMALFRLLFSFLFESRRDVTSFGMMRCHTRPSTFPSVNLTTSHICRLLPPAPPSLPRPPFPASSMYRPSRPPSLPAFPRVLTCS